MLVIQKLDLRKHLPDWRMSVYEVLSHKNGVATRTGEWEVVLARSRPDFVVSVKNENAYWAFEYALKDARKMQQNYDEKQKKTS
jgi:hypothetical protein